MLWIKITIRKDTIRRNYGVNNRTEINNPLHCLLREKRGSAKLIEWQFQVKILHGNVYGKIE